MPPSKANDRMEVDSDSDISIDLEQPATKGKGKAKAKAVDKRKPDKGKGKAKDTVRGPFGLLVLREMRLRVRDVRCSKHILGKHHLRVLGRRCKRMRPGVCKLLSRISWREGADGGELCL
jgi:hypothetical protein